jgi:hypothetical protein
VDLPGWARGRGSGKRGATEWTGGVAHGFSEMEEADLAFWMVATPAERIRGVTMLIDEMCAMGGERGPTPRLQRTVGGVRPQRS